MKLRLIFLARSLALAWAGFWLFFFVAESAAYHTPLHMALPWVGIGLLFVLLALLPWRWEMTGGILLILVGLSAGVAYAVWPPPLLSVAIRALTCVVLGAPPLAAGILFLMRCRSVTSGA